MLVRVESERSKTAEVGWSHAALLGDGGRTSGGSESKDKDKQADELDRSG